MLSSGCVICQLNKFDVSPTDRPDLPAPPRRYRQSLLCEAGVEAADFIGRLFRSLAASAQTLLATKLESNAQVMAIFHHYSSNYVTPDREFPLLSIPC